MSGWLKAGAPRRGDLPADRLIPEEARDLVELMTLHAELLSQTRVVEQRLELLLLAIRDRRGLTGPVQVNPSTGQIQVEGQGGSDGQPQ